MKHGIIYTFVSLLLLANLCSGQNAPVAPLKTTAGSEVSLSYMLILKNRNWDLGNGGDVTAMQYFSRHLGLSAEAGAFSMNRYKLREGGIRVGPIYRFNAGGDFQPFVHALAGYSVVSATYLPSHRWGGTVLVGGGTEFRLKGALFARATTDFVDNWDASTRYGRGTIGFAYHFGDLERK